jgi:hypothetical protein
MRYTIDMMMIEGGKKMTNEMMMAVAEKIKQFDHGRDCAKRDREIYGRPFPYDETTEFGKGYWYEVNNPPKRA